MSYLNLKCLLETHGMEDQNAHNSKKMDWLEAHIKLGVARKGHGSLRTLTAQDVEQIILGV